MNITWPNNALHGQLWRRPQNTYTARETLLRNNAVSFVTNPYKMVYFVILNSDLYSAGVLDDIYKGFRPVLRGGCCHNAQGCVRNRTSNPEDDKSRDLTYCSHKPEWFVTANPERSVLITIITWNLQFHLVNVYILHWKYKYGPRSESRFACYPHCYVTWCLTIPVGKGRCTCDALPYTLNIVVFKTVSKNSATIKRIYK